MLLSKLRYMPPLKDDGNVIGLIQHYAASLLADKTTWTISPEPVPDSSPEWQLVTLKHLHTIVGEEEVHRDQTANVAQMKKQSNIFYCGVLCTTLRENH